MSHTIFKLICATIFFYLLNAGCRKSIDKPVNYIHSKVLELETEMPIGGAQVKLYQCTQPGSSGCRAESMVDTEITDSAGNFQYDSRLNVYAITASHSRYIDGSTGGIGAGLGLIHLAPLACTKIHFLKVNPHPDDLLLTLETGTEPSPSLASFLYYPLFSDTTIYIRSSGNINNTLVWLFSDKDHVVVPSETGGQIAEYYISRFDTAFVELHY